MDNIETVMYHALSEINPWCHQGHHVYRNAWSEVGDQFSFEKDKGDLFSKKVWLLPYQRCIHCHKRSNDRD